MRSSAGAVLLALTALSSHDLAAGEPEHREPTCLARARAHLPGETMATFVKGGLVGRKRLLFRRGDVLLVIDFEVLDSITQEFLKERGGATSQRFPEEVRLLQRFVQAFKNRDEVDADSLLRGKLEQEQLDFRLAEVFERGAFLIRWMPPISKRTVPTVHASADLILRLDFSYECGERCGTGGRVFFTDACQQLVAVTDWVH
jgi:hypothetical protein